MTNVIQQVLDLANIVRLMTLKKIIRHASIRENTILSALHRFIRKLWMTLLCSIDCRPRHPKYEFFILDFDCLVSNDIPTNILTLNRTNYTDILLAYHQIFAIEKILKVEIQKTKQRVQQNI